MTVEEWIVGKLRPKPHAPTQSAKPADPQEVKLPALNKEFKWPWTK